MSTVSRSQPVFAASQSTREAEEPGADRCVAFYSGGLSSYEAAKRAVARFGPKRTTLLFTDTNMEDPDLYRFRDEGAAKLGAELVVLSDGRDVWGVFNDEGLIGNTRKDPCSRILKREIAQRWLDDHCEKERTVLVFGIGPEETHRYDGDPLEPGGLRRGVKNVYGRMGWPHVWAPLLDSPWLTAWDIRASVRADGLAIPRLYAMGFAHNNCGGFCVKAGEGQFAHLLWTMPQRYAFHEDQEAAFNAARPGKRRQTVLAPEREVGRDEKGKIVRKRVPISLREFREHVEAGGRVDLFDVGGCDCFYPPEAA